MTEVFPYTHPTGYLFSVNEQVALATSLPLLLTQTKRRRVRVWGKVFGHKANYILAQTFDEDLVAEPELFYSLDEGLTFTLIGTTSSLLRGVAHLGHTPMEHEAFKHHLLREIRGIFMGDPAYEYRIPSHLGSTRSGSPRTEVKSPNTASRSYKESLRLAVFVEEHDFHCRIAPRGAFFRSLRQSNLPAEIRPNPAFPGLPRTPGGALSLFNYYHLRAPNPYRELLERQPGKLPGLVEIFAQPALDAGFASIAEDVPEGLWRLQYDPLHNLLVGRNAKFPGAIFYHVPDTPTYGSIYLGDGTINQNIAFTI